MLSLFQMCKFFYSCSYLKGTLTLQVAFCHALRHDLVVGGHLLLRLCAVHRVVHRLAAPASLGGVSGATALRGGTGRFQQLG